MKIVHSKEYTQPDNCMSDQKRLTLSSGEKPKEINIALFLSASLIRTLLNSASSSSIKGPRYTDQVYWTTLAEEDDNE